MIKLVQDDKGYSKHNLHRSNFHGVNSKKILGNDDLEMYREDSFLWLVGDEEDVVNL